ncbi:MAG TPA: DUF5131 family protein [Phycisphaerae bacterium]|nr:DUF5131 family protein [Phycisphaerae bacterium]
MTTKIDWCDETINPITGCRQGCRFCYARRMAHRFAGKAGSVYQRVAAATSGVDPETGILDGDGDPFAPAIHLDVSRRHGDRLRRARKPRRVFVGSMGDVCFDGEAVSFGNDGKPFQSLLFNYNTNDVQAHVARFATGLPRHTFLLLTKRPDLLDVRILWPRNVHFGVTIGHGMASDWARLGTFKRRVHGMCANGRPGVLWASVEPLGDPGFDPTCLTGLDWVVVGLQTGSGKASPGTEKMTALLGAVQRIVDWCAGAGVSCFVKDNARYASSGGHLWPRQIPTAET